MLIKTNTPSFLAAFSRSFCLSGSLFNASAGRHGERSSKRKRETKSERVRKTQFRGGKLFKTMHTTYACPGERRLRKFFFSNRNCCVLSLYSRLFPLFLSVSSGCPFLFRRHLISQSLLLGSERGKEEREARRARPAAASSRCP